MCIARKQLLPVFPEGLRAIVRPRPQLWPFRGPGGWVEDLARFEPLARVCSEVLLDDGCLRYVGEEQTHGHESLHDVMRNVSVWPGAHNLRVVLVVVQLKTELVQQLHAEPSPVEVFLRSRRLVLLDSNDEIH